MRPIETIQSEIDVLLESNRIIWVEMSDLKTPRERRVQLREEWHANNLRLRDLLAERDMERGV